MRHFTLIINCFSLNVVFQRDIFNFGFLRFDIKSFFIVNIIIIHVFVAKTTATNLLALTWHWHSIIIKE